MSLSLAGAVFLAMAIPTSVLIYLAVDEQMDNDDFLANGKRGKAKVLKVIDKTQYRNKRTIPYAELVLEVSVPNYETYQTKTTQSIPAIHAPRVQPGSTIDVLVDPDQPNNDKRIMLLLE